MSCYIVDQGHIDVLVHSWEHWVRQGRISPLRPGLKTDYTSTHVGQVLLDANYKSFNERYDHEDPAEIYERRGGERLESIAIIKAIHGYEYQSCEAADWETSEAHRIIELLECFELRAVPGYEDADWEVTR